MPEAAPHSDDLLPIGVVLAEVNVSKPTLYRWIAKGDFPRPKQLPGSIVRFRRSDVDAWKASLPDASIGQAA